MVSGSAPAADFLDLETGLRVAAPAGWRRGQATGGATTWNDASSETAYLTVRALHPPVDEAAHWNVLVEEARARPGYVELGLSNEAQGNQQVHALRSIWSEGEQQRFAAVILVTLGEMAPAAVIEAHGLPAEQSALDVALAGCTAGTTRQTP